MTHGFVQWDVDGTLVTTGVVGRRALEGGAADAAGLDTTAPIPLPPTLIAALV